jgi:hypothetical protein
VINPNNLNEILKALDRQIQVNDGAPVSLVICGGTAEDFLRKYGYDIISERI